MVDTASSPETVVAPVKKAPRKLVEDEKKERGRVAKEVWFMYFKVSWAATATTDRQALGGPLYCPWQRTHGLTIRDHLPLQHADRHGRTRRREWLASVRRSAF